MSDETFASIEGPREPVGGTPRIRRVGADRAVAWLRAGWTYLTRAPIVWAVVLGIFVVCTVLLGLVPFVGVLNVLLLPLLLAGILHGCRALDRGERLELQHVLDGFQHNTPNLLLLGLLQLAISAVIGAVLFMATIGAIGLTAFTAASVDSLTGPAVVSGIFFVVLLGLALSVPATMAFWFAPGLVSFHNLSPVEAVRLSVVACLRNWVPLLVYGLLLLPLALLSLLTFGLGFLVLIPVGWGSLYASYVDVFER